VTRPILRPKSAPNRFGEGLASGVEILGTVVVLFFIGWGLDAWLDTGVTFRILLVIFAFAAKTLVLYYRYEARMREHEAEHPRLRPPPAQGQS
jgi:hypothetical protein